MTLDKHCARREQRCTNAPASLPSNSCRTVEDLKCPGVPLRIAVEQDAFQLHYTTLQLPQTACLPSATRTQGQRPVGLSAAAAITEDTPTEQRGYVDDNTYDFVYSPDS